MSPTLEVMATHLGMSDAAVAKLEEIIDLANSGDEDGVFELGMVDTDAWMELEQLCRKLVETSFLDY